MYVQFTSCVYGHDSLGILWLSDFVSKIILTKIAASLGLKHVVALYFTKKDKLRSANKLPRKIRIWGRQKIYCPLNFILDINVDIVEWWPEIWGLLMLCKAFEK